MTTTAREASRALRGVPRSMLWTLYCRAAAGSENPAWSDPEAEALVEALELDGRRAFGKPERCFARRARLFDARLQAFLDRHPNQVTVVSLGEGLETQRARVQGYARWISVDLPESMAIRDEVYPPGPQHDHRAGSATELSLWTDALLGGPSFVVAQGLFMYLPWDEVDTILRGWRQAPYPSALSFDVVPPWIAQLSKFQLPVSPSFRVPHMHWGTRMRGLRSLLEPLAGGGTTFELEPCPLPSGPLPFADRTVIAHLWQS